MITYQIEGMHCASCVRKVTDALEPHAETVTVTLVPPQAVLNNPASLNDLNLALSAVGAYRLLPVAAPLAETVSEKTLKTYYPLALIVGFISVVALKGAATPHAWMLHFMAGFFIVFSFFKLLDRRGFADAYAGYDLLAARWRGYGLIYPFLELGLGLAFLFDFQVRLAL